MSELIWLPEALLDLTEHFEFLKLKNPEAAGRVAQSIRDAGFSLAQNPNRGTLLTDGSDRRKLIIPWLTDKSSETLMNSLLEPANEFAPTGTKSAYAD
ncbi:MAG: type II toxin-antitoxin system RelE/ParE family toxin [Thermosynechococcaceae cyanobacterium MS004]|nr:type II toxin-antitoxin system RelE/ParE family toxin [Thermosynechococcaceae cyanobacterium MS004]